MVIWYSQEHMMFFKNWKVIDLGRVKTADFELCQHELWSLMESFFSASTIQML